MIEKIKRYFEQSGLHDALLERKLQQYSKNEDILREFVYWLDNEEYIENGLVVEGYTAKSISELSEYLVGEGSFSLLIMLRENPEKAKKKINQGFNIK